jgi:hypothetical protein
MKLRTIILITGILVAGIASIAAAQTRPEKNSSAKAYYSHKPHKPKFKTKKYKKQKYALRKSSRKLRAFYKNDGPRRRSVRS